MANALSQPYRVMKRPEIKEKEHEPIPSCHRLLICGAKPSKILAEWRLSGKLINSCKRITDGNHFVQQCHISADNKCIFTIFDNKLEKFDLNTKNLMHNYGLLPKCSLSNLATTTNGKYLFVGISVISAEPLVGNFLPLPGIESLKNIYGLIAQIDVNKDKLVKIHGIAYNDSEIKINSICITSDDKYLFSADSNGTIKQLNIKTSR